MTHGPVHWADLAGRHVIFALRQRQTQRLQLMIAHSKSLPRLWVGLDVIGF